MQNYLKILCFAFSVQVLFPGSGLPQDTQNYPENPKAVELFINGKTAELKGDIRLALENYRTALKYDNAAGIHFAISKINIELGKYQDALLDINNALKINPQNNEYLEQKASIYYGTGKLDKAAEIYETILISEPENVSVLYALARAYQDLKLPSRAVEIYEKITDIYGFEQDVLKRMYDIYYTYKEYDKCIRVIEYMLKLDPYETSFRLELASLYLRLGRDEEAQGIYEELYKLNPDNLEIQTEIVKIYFRNKEIEKGFDKFARIVGKDSLNFDEKVQLGEMYYNVVSQDASVINIVDNIFEYLNLKYPDKWTPYFYLGQIDLANQKKEDAFSKFMKSLDYAGESKEAYLQIGYTLFNMEKYENAEQVLSKALELAPEDFRTGYFYGLVLQRLGREPEAIKYFEIAHMQNPDELTILSSLALAYNTQKMYVESDGAYEKALKIDPENALILNNYAYNLSVRGVKLDKALEMARTAVNKEPGNPSYLDTIGWIFYMMKDYKSALEYIEKAVSINGSSAVLLDHLGDVHKALNDIQKAKYFWKRALDLNPGNKAIEEKINFYQ